MPKLRPLRTAEEIAAVPADQPVLIEIPNETVAITASSSDAEPVVEKVEAKPEPAAEPEPESTLQKQLDDLKKAEESARRQLAESQAREQAAMRTINTRNNELYQERGEREQAQYDAVLNALGAAQAEADKAQNDYEAGLAGQDYRLAAEAQRRLTVATARMVQLEDGKAVFEARAQEPRPAPQPERAQGDPIDAMTHLSSRQRDWLKGHRDAQTDPAKLARLGAAHWDALEAGHAQDSDAYFATLEEKLGYRQPAPAAKVVDDDDYVSPEPKHRSMPVSAPVSRDSPSLSTGRATPTRVELTAAQREHARVAGVDDVTYAKNVLRLKALKAEGHYQERG